MFGASASLWLILLFTGGWPLWRHDEYNSAAARFEEGPGGTLRGWTYGLRKQVYGYRPAMAVWSPPALGRVGERPVVAAGACDRQVYLFDALSGELLWRFATGGGVYSAPLVWQDGQQTIVFAASSDRSVYALDARQGVRLWSTAVVEYRPTIGEGRLSAPALGEAEGKEALFVGYWVYDQSLSRNLQSGGLAALEARSGRILWRADFLDQRVSAPLFHRLEGKGVVFVSSEDGNLRALAADNGKVLWHHRQTQPVPGAPVFFESRAGPRLVVGGLFGRVVCLDARDGSEVWSFFAGNWVAAPALYFRRGERSLVAFGAYDRRFYALDAESGEKVWSQTVAGPVYSAPALISTEPEPQLVFAALDHQLYGVSGLDGTLLWSVYCGRPLWEGTALGDSHWGSPAAASFAENWMVYFGSYDGVFYALPLAQLRQSSGSQPWSNLRFAVLLLATLAGTAALALALSRRRRKLSGGEA